MKTYFISDLHLSAEDNAKTELFLGFIKQLHHQASQLYILGDFFEYWVGDDCENDLSDRVASALSALAESGSQLYFMPGNRDFLLGNQYCSRCKMTRLDDPSVIEIGANKILLAHGDAYCTADRDYQRFRKITRNRFIQTCFLLLPRRKRIAIANKMRANSQSTVLPLDIQDVTLSAIAQACEQHQVNTIIHGHTHQPAIHWFHYQNQLYHRIVLSDWHDKAHTFSLDEQANSSLEYL